MTSSGGAPTPDPTDAELVARQAALQAEAAAAIADLDLFPLLATVGRPVQTGSVALGLMVWRDIDVTILCPTLDLDVALEPLRSLAIHPRVRQVQFRNDTGPWNVDPAYPDGLYLGLDYRPTAEQTWKLDLWFLLEGTTQFDLEHIVSLPPRLTRRRVLRSCGSRTPGIDAPSTDRRSGATTSIRPSSTTACGRRRRSPRTSRRGPVRTTSPPPVRSR